MTWQKKMHTNWLALMNILGINNVIVDTFNRPNSTTPGTTDTGQQWMSISTAGTFTINNNQLFSDATPRASVLASPRNYKVGFRYILGGTNTISGLVMKINDDHYDCLRLVVSGGQWRFQRRVPPDGKTTILASFGEVNIGDYVEVLVNGDRFDVYINGEYKGGVNESYNNEIDFVGFYSGDNTNIRYDDFILEGLP